MSTAPATFFDPSQLSRVPVHELRPLRVLAGRAALYLEIMGYTCDWPRGCREIEAALLARENAVEAAQRSCEILRQPRTVTDPGLITPPTRLPHA